MSREGAGLTRRAVLRGAAVAGAAALARPGVGLARTGPPVFSQYIGALTSGATAPIAVPRTFTLAGVQWSEPAAAGIELRTRGVGARAGWSPWVNASVRGHDPDGAPSGEGQYGEPIWTGPASLIQLRSAGAVRGVSLHFVDAETGSSPAAPGSSARPAPGSSAGPAPGTSAGSAQATALAQPVLDAGPGQPPIISRAAWARGNAPPRHVPEYGTVRLAFVHHSETANGYGPTQVPSILFSIFVYHRYVRDYFDIAYNFAVDDFGRIWEARAGGIDEAVIGAHAGGYNAQSTGVVVLGSFMALTPPPAALDALQRLLAWKLSLHGVPALGRATVEVSPDGAAYTRFAPGAHVSLPRIAGHRDGDQTSCPGDALYARLPALRPRVAALAGNAAHLSIAAAVPAQASGASFAVAGRLTDVRSGAPLAGAGLEIQQIGPRGGETTIATLSTGADGSWSYTATPSETTLLRALHRDAPAAVSDIVVLAVAPVLTLSVVSLTPLIVSGTVTPAGPPVTVELYRVGARGRRQLVASRSLAAAGGTFSARLKHPGAGRYVLIARTAATSRFAAGVSPPLSLTL